MNRTVNLRNQTVASASKVAVRPASTVRAFAPVSLRPLRVSRANVIVKAEADSSAATTAPASTANLVPVMKPEDLPKGVRKEVRVGGQSILLFWYRNEIYAIEARSPAEGAYSEGFIKSKFTQDYGIECPTTGSVFSLKTGEVLDWYPNNFVLSMLTPKSTCRPLQIFPVVLKQDAIYIDTSVSGGSMASRGGSDTSIENNNVYGLEPKVYVQGADSEEEQGGGAVATTASIVVGIVAAAGLLIAGSATIYYYLFRG